MTARFVCFAPRAALRAGALAAALAVTGCASATGPAATPASAPAASPSSGAAATTTPVAELQAGLTALLVERAYAVAAATAAVDASGGSVVEPRAAAALAALDAGTVALADVLGATYRDAREPLLQALRRGDRLLREHAVALATGNDPGQVRAELDDAHAELAEVVRRAVPTLDAEEVAARLGLDVRTQLSPRSYAQLHAAAHDATSTARLLADGIAADRGLGRPGTVAARLRADLSGLMTEHVVLSVEPGARTVLRDNARELADAVGERYPAVRAELLRAWTAHLDRLERYAAARAAGGDGAAELALVRGFPDELSRLLSRHLTRLPASSARTELVRALDAQVAALDEAAVASSSAPAAVRQAVAAALPAAALLSAAVAEDLRLS